MAKIIFTSRYHKNIVSKRGNLLSYMGTREGVEKIQNAPSKDKPPTKEQEALIKSLIKKCSEAKEYAEYEAYINNPSRASASEFNDQNEQDRSRKRCCFRNRSFQEGR